MSVTDDAVRERHGVACRMAGNKETSITVWEDGQWVCIDPNFEMRFMTAYQARYLASKLYRLSRRIRARSETDQ